MENPFLPASFAPQGSQYATDPKIIKPVGLVHWTVLGKQPTKTIAPSAARVEAAASGAGAGVGGSEHLQSLFLKPAPKVLSLAGVGEAKLTRAVVRPASAPSSLYNGPNELPFPIGSPLRSHSHPELGAGVTTPMADEAVSAFPIMDAPLTPLPELSLPPAVDAPNPFAISAVPTTPWNNSFAEPEVVGPGYSPYPLPEDRVPTPMVYKNQHTPAPRKSRRKENVTFKKLGATLHQFAKAAKGEVEEAGMPRRCKTLAKGDIDRAERRVARAYARAKRTGDRGQILHSVTAFENSVLYAMDRNPDSRVRRPWGYR